MSSKFDSMSKYTLTNLAMFGDRDAQYYLAINHSKNYDEQILWLQKATMNGHPEATLELNKRSEFVVEKAKKVFHSQKKISIKENNLFTDKKSFKSMTKDALLSIANSGNCEAQYYIAMHHCKSNFEKLEWIKKAAYNGCPEAQFNLANKYRVGLDVNKNIDTAIDLYKKSASLGNVQAQIKLKELVPSFSPIDKNSSSQKKLKKHLPVVTFDKSYDGRPRFSSERKAKEYLLNRIKRACNDFKKYFEILNSYRLSKPLTEYYSQELNTLRIPHDSKDLQLNLDRLLIKYYEPYYESDLIDDSIIGYKYGEYYYDVSKVLNMLEKHTKLNSSRFATDAYNYIVNKYNIEN